MNIWLPVTLVQFGIWALPVILFALIVSTAPSELEGLPRILVSGILLVIYYIIAFITSGFGLL